MSASDAATVPTAVWFSAASNVVDEVNTGPAFASVVPRPEPDQSLLPSSFLASTCTLYSVFSASSPIVAPSSVIVVVVTSIHGPSGDLTW